MAFFKTEEEKLREDQELIKQYESSILKQKEYIGQVGHIHQGLSYAGVWGVRNNGKVKFKSTKFKIHETKLLIERNKMIVNYSEIKEIFQEEDREAIIILENGDGIPIKSKNNSRIFKLRFKAFINLLNKFKEENTGNNVQTNEKTSRNSEDKVDKLIKLGEMYDKGLLSDEEFALMKHELFAENNDENGEDNETFEDNAKPSENICENCGFELSPEDIFCSECGSQIK